MTCKHGRGDPACSSSPSYDRAVESLSSDYARYGNLPKQCEPGTDYDVDAVAEYNGHLVMRVKFNCAYEGLKTMVFLDTTLADAIRWRVIDPHFTRSSTQTVNAAKHAPPPAARFPSTADGWCDAVAYAESKPRGRKA